MSATLVAQEEATSVWPLILRYRPHLDLSNNEGFFAFCQDNAPWQIERNPQGEIVVKMPTGGESGARNAELTAQLVIWARQNGAGKAFDSNTGFDLPNGAMRAPDAAWVKNERLSVLTAEQKKKFLPLAPDFVVELRSDTDSLRLLQEKMREYVNDGVALALLLDPMARRVFVYRPNAEVETHDNPVSIDCSPELRGFHLDTRAIFEAVL